MSLDCRHLAEAVMQALDIGIITCDAAGRVVSMNAAAGELLGTPPEAGAACGELLASALASDVSWWPVALSAAMRGGASRHEGTAARPGGAEAPLELCVKPLRENEAVAGVLLTVAPAAPWPQPARQEYGASPAMLAGLFRAAVETTNDLVYAVDPDLRVVYANPAARALCERSGHSPDAVGKLVCEAYPWVPTQVADEYRQAFATGRTVAADRSFVHEGQTVTARSWKVPVWEQGRVALVVTVAKDLTPVRRVETALRESEELLRTVFEAAGSGIALVDPTGRTVECNPAMGRLLGYTPDEICAIPLGELIHPHDVPEYRRMMREFAAGVSEREQTPRRYIRKDGQVLWGIITVTPVRDGAGALRFIVGILEDVTERRRIEESLREKTELLAAVQNASPLPITVVARDGTILAWNPAAERLFGWPAEEVLGRFNPSVPPDELAAFADMRQRVFTGEAISGLTVTRLRRDGSSVPTSLFVAPVHDAGGQVSAIMTIQQDISAELEARAALQESEQTAWALLNATNDVATLIAPDLTLLAANEAAARVLGRTIGALTGTNLLDYLPARVADEVRARVAEALSTGQPMRYEDAWNDRTLTHTIYPVLDAGGHITRLAAFVQDITDRRRAEDSQRLAAVGQLAAGVAHEFNNILASMMLRAERAALVGNSLEQYAKLAELVLRQGGRGAEITRALTAFASPREPRREPLLIEHPIEAALAVAARQIESSAVVVERNYCAGDCCVLADASQLEQVFLNIIINACQAMPGGGRLGIATEYAAPAGETGGIVVRVTDTGEGIAPEHLPHIFEPFFTTKGRLGESDVPGTGLGLSVSRGIIAAHGGTITARSQVGVGTTLELTFVAHGPDAAGTLVEPPPLRAAAGDHVTTILLAEDDDDLSSMMADSLAAEGYRVTTAASVGEALRALGGTPFDLVITDLTMPGGGGGREILDAARALPRPPPVVVTTGRVEGDVPDGLRQAGAAKCLFKPFPLPALFQAVADALRSAGQS